MIQMIILMIIVIVIVIGQAGLRGPGELRPQRGLLIIIILTMIIIS